jgi:hypothetical protein
VIGVQAVEELEMKGCCCLSVDLGFGVAGSHVVSFAYGRVRYFGDVVERT